MRKRALDAARRAHERSGSLLGVAIADCYRAVVERASGHLDRAAGILRAAIAEARSRAGEGSYAEALAGSLLAELAYEAGQCDEAQSLIERLGPQIEGSAIILYPLATVPTYARLMRYFGREAQALDVLEKVYAQTTDGVYRRLASMLAHERVRMLLGQRRVNEARQFLDRHLVRPRLDGPAGEFDIFAEVRLLTAEARLAEAERLLARCWRRRTKAAASAAI